jgi:Tol biopolymer transport system component
LLFPPPKDITVFYTYVTYEYPGGKGMDQDQVESTAEVWRIRGDGSGKQKLFGERLLSSWMVGTRSLNLSGNSQNLVFVQAYNKWRASSASSSLWVMGIDGSNAREWIGRSDVKPGSPDWSKENEAAFNAKESPVFPAWSPNGFLIAFVDPVAQGEPGRVNILDVESDRRWDVNEGEVFAWSPDGTMLALYSRIPSAVVRDLQIVNVDGETPSIVALPPSVWLRSLDWSAATGLIAAHGVKRGEPAEFILVIDPAKGTSKVVVEDSYNASGSGPKWSPDGRMIAFERNVDGVDNLHILDWDTGDERLVMSNVGWFGVWSPDSRLILVESQVQGNGL